MAEQDYERGGWGLEKHPEIKVIIVSKALSDATNGCNGAYQLM